MTSKQVFVAIDIVNHKEGSNAFRTYGKQSYKIKSCSSDEPNKYEMGKDDVRLHEDLCMLSTADGIPFQYWTPKGDIGTVPRILLGGRGVYFGLLSDKKTSKSKVNIADKLAELRKSETRPALAIN